MSMNKHNDEDIYRHIAQRYQQQAGEQLHKQRQLLDQAPRSEQWHTQRMDAAVKDKTRGESRRKIIRFTTAVAACFILVVLAPLMSRLFSNQNSKETTMESQAEAAMEAAPLSFTLPDNLSVASTEQDRDMTIYYLDDTRLDPVVMQMESTETAALNTTGLVEIEIEGRRVYAASTDSYNLLTFEYQEMIYTLTCVHDINTLTGICNNIF